MYFFCAFRVLTGTRQEAHGMNTQYLDGAKARVPNVPLLINLISRRVRQLNRGDRPLVKPDGAFMEKMDIALKEVAEGKLTAEILPGREESARDRAVAILGDD